MDIKIGQRWKYLTDDFDMVAEIIQTKDEFNSVRMRTCILQANQYAINSGYAVGSAQFDMGIGRSSKWSYLEGQDKPE